MAFNAAGDGPYGFSFELRRTTFGDEVVGRNDALTSPGDRIAE